MKRCLTPDLEHHLRESLVIFGYLEGAIVHIPQLEPLP